MNPENIRQIFKQFNCFMVLMWRLGLGRFINCWPAGFGRILVLTHTGRKSGLRRRTPLNYAIVDGQVYVLAGFGKKADWYKNLLANPHVELWLPDGWWAGEVLPAPEPERQLALIRQVLINSGFAAPLFGIYPRRMSDAELEQTVKDYELVRIRRGQAFSGAGGPGDLAWVWLVLLPVVLRWMRRRRKKGK